jgi:hypothetical protein
MKRVHQSGKRRTSGRDNPTGGGVRAFADLPGAVGERKRREADKKFDEEMRRKAAHLRLKRALKNLSQVMGDRPMLTAEKTIAEAAQLEILSRLSENPESLPPTVLNRIKDSAINSVARMEQWDKKKDDSPQSALEAVVNQMSKLKGKLKIEVSMEEETPKDPLLEAIDVTPEPVLLDKVSVTD